MRRGDRRGIHRLLASGVARSRSAAVRHTDDGADRPGGHGAQGDQFGIAGSPGRTLRIVTVEVGLAHSYPLPSGRASSVPEKNWAQVSGLRYQQAKDLEHGHTVDPIDIDRLMPASELSNDVRGFEIHMSVLDEHPLLARIH